MFSFYQNFDRKTQQKSEAAKRKEEIYSTVSFTTFTQIYCAILIIEHILRMILSSTLHDNYTKLIISISLVMSIYIISSVLKNRIHRFQLEDFKDSNFRSKIDIKKALISVLMIVFIFESNLNDLISKYDKTPVNYFWLSQDIMIYCFISLYTLNNTKIVIFILFFQSLYFYFRFENVDDPTQILLTIAKEIAFIFILKNLKQFWKLIAAKNFQKYKEKKLGKKVLSLLPDGIVIVDKEGIQYANDSVYSVLNTNKDNILNDLFSMNNDNIEENPENVKDDQSKVKVNEKPKLLDSQSKSILKIQAKRILKTIDLPKLEICSDKKIRKSATIEENDEEKETKELKSDRTHYTSMKRSNLLKRTSRKDSTENSQIEAETKKNNMISKSLDHLIQTAMLKTKVLNFASYLVNEFKKEHPTTVKDAINFILSRADKEFSPDMLAKKSTLNDNTLLSVSGDQTYLMNSHRIHSSGNICNYEIRFIPIIFRSTPAVCILFRDVTERELRKKYEEKEKNTFRTLASVSHEFRTPLNAIISMLHSMKQKIFSQELLKENLLPAENSAKLLLHLVNDILDINQIQEKKIKIVPVCFNLKQVLDQTLELFRIQAEYKGIKIQLDYDNQAPETIKNDPNRFRQIIINLVGNAMKFTLKGEISIKVEESVAKKLLIKVKDTGIGIKKSNLTKLFKAFGKVDNIREQELNPQGVGLGLVISNQLAKLLCHDKQFSGLNVNSSPNVGSTFFFYIDDLNSDMESFELCDESTHSITEKVSNFPKFSNVTKLISTDKSLQFELSFQNNMQTSSLNDQVMRDNSIKEFQDAYKGCSILVVDDSIFNQIALKEMLKPLGFIIDLASNGREAIEKAKSFGKGYSLIFMDIEMPVMNGIDCSSQIQKLMNKEKIPKCPIIGQSGYGEDHKAICFQSGMSDFLQKPISVNDLLKLIMKWAKK